MATFKYTIASGCDTGLMQKHSHSSLISDINNSAKNNMPRGAVISSARVVLVMSHNGGLGSADLNVWLCNNESDNSGENLISGSTNKNDDKTYQKDISSKITKNYPFTFNTSYSRIAVYYKSTTHRHYRDRDFYVEYTYSVPTYTVTVNAGTGGTVSGGGTFENGTTTTITAIPNTGYRFVKWSHGITTSSIHLIVNGNGTYTAEFEPIKCNLTVTCEASVSGEKCTVTGGGTYKYGDTVTIQATNIPPNHRLLNWEYTHDRALSVISAGSDNPLTITLDETLFSDFYYEDDFNAQFICVLNHTGFRLKADASPAEGGVVEHGWYYMHDGEEYYFSKVIPSEGTLIDYKTGLRSVVEAIPNKGYKFVKWGDGNTENPRPLSLIGDASYTAIFELDKINKIYVGTQQPKAIYIGTQEVKEVYVGTEKVYG